MQYYEYSINDNDKLAAHTNCIVFAKCGMYGPFVLETEVVDEKVGAQIAGNYRLSRNSPDTFVVSYIGRSDNELANRIKDHIKEGYKSFVWAPKDSPIEAYNQECEDFHYYGGDIGAIDNDKDLGHPHSPKGETLSCPVCKA